MKHFANRDFWKSYYQLPQQIQDLADDNFKFLKENPRHPSLHLKKVSRFWSVRVGIHYRSIGIESPEGIVWFWIGTHEEYNKLLLTICSTLLPLARQNVTQALCI